MYLVNSTLFLNSDCATRPKGPPGPGNQSKRSNKVRRDKGEIQIWEKNQTLDTRTVNETPVRLYESDKTKNVILKLTFFSSRKGRNTICQLCTDISCWPNQCRLVPISLSFQVCLHWFKDFTGADTFLLQTHRPWDHEFRTAWAPEPNKTLSYVFKWATGFWFSTEKLNFTAESKTKENC